MDDDRARTLIEEQRAEVHRLLAELDAAARQDRAEENESGTPADRAQPLTDEGVDDAVRAALRDRLASLDRAAKRLAAGTFGRSVRSGLPIPDERLEADPAAELTVEEAAKRP